MNGSRDGASVEVVTTVDAIIAAARARLGTVSAQAVYDILRALDAAGLGPTPSATGSPEAGRSPPEMQDRVVTYWTKVDPDLGAPVAQGLGREAHSPSVAVR